MTTYFEYGVNLTDNQKRSLASAMNNRTLLTLRLKNSNLSGNDELMLTKTQISRIQKSLANGTGVDIKISKPCKPWSKGIALCCKRSLKSCTSFGNWCCFRIR